MWLDHPLARPSRPPDRSDAPVRLNHGLTRPEVVPTIPMILLDLVHALERNLLVDVVCGCGQSSDLWGGRPVCRSGSDVEVHAEISAPTGTPQTARFKGFWWTSP